MSIEEKDRRWIRKLHDAGVANEKIAQVANKSVDEVGKIINRQRQNEKAHTG
jgi:IS30 family transposase